MAILSLSSAMQFAHFTALMQVAAHIYRSPRFLRIAILSSHHTDFISRPRDNLHTRGCSAHFRPMVQIL
jgi:hypothetical protein